MNIKQEYEQELMFQVEPENKKSNEELRTRKIIRIATKNLKKLTLDRLRNRTGEC